MSANPVKSSARTLDQFYTNRQLVPSLIQMVHAHIAQSAFLSSSPHVWLEPAAGDGAFLDQMPAGSVGLDLSPGRPNIKQGDFLLWSPPVLPATTKSTPQSSVSQWVVVGNPPFGKNASLAVKFFNHAAKFAHLIAFIVPRTFEKDSLQHRLDPHFQLCQELVLDPNSFSFEGQPISVPCVFQIWEKSALPQVKSKGPKMHADFTRVPDPKQADFAFQRVGVAAGRIKDMTATHLAPPSHHFIRVTNRLDVKKVRARFENIDFSHVKAKTAGNPSISLSELVSLYSAQP